MRLGASFSFVGSLNESINEVALKEEKLAWFLGLLLAIEIGKEMIARSTSDNPFFDYGSEIHRDEKIGTTHKGKKEVLIIPGMVPPKMTAAEDTNNNNENIILGTMTDSTPVLDSSLGLPHVTEA